MCGRYVNEATLSHYILTFQFFIAGHECNLLFNGLVQVVLKIFRYCTPQDTESAYECCGLFRNSRPIKQLGRESLQHQEGDGGKL